MNDKFQNLIGDNIYPNTNLTEDQIKRIKELRDKGKTIMQIVELTGIKKHKIRKYIETKSYGNNRYLTDLTNVSKSIYEIAEIFKNEVILNENKHGNRKNGMSLYRLWLLTYSLGARIGELTRPDYKFDIHLENTGKWTWIRGRKINEKHFDDKEKKIRSWSQLAIPVTNMWDAKITEAIFSNGQEGIRRLQNDFDYYTMNANITNSFKNAFKADLTDRSGTIYNQAGINPHLLRHLRAYNLLVNQKFNRVDVQGMMGWDNDEMIDYYAYISEQLQGQNLQESILGSLKQSYGDDSKPNMNSIVKPFPVNIPKEE